MSEHLPIEQFQVITYKDTVQFKYKVDEQEHFLEREITLVWEDTLESFQESFQNEKSYEIHTFKTKSHQNRFMQDIEDETDELIEQVNTEISQKSKFGFEYTSPTYED
jgi:hypothetical protein